MVRPENLRLHCNVSAILAFHETRAEWPNDPKLSDGGAWRGSCVVERSEGIRAREKGGSDETDPS